ncbi:unnamed protein product [Closterium sp. NIES-53]
MTVPLLYFGTTLVYVDDLLAASSSTAMLKELKELLEAAFELREISPSYVDKLRRRFIDEEQTGRRPKTPVFVDAYAELNFDNEDFQSREEEEYRQKVGSLLFAATTTRPDIAFTSAAGQKTLKLVGYADADNAGDKQALSSTNGYVFTFGSAAESWTSQRIKCVTLSSTESEYILVTEAGKEARRLRFLLAEIQLLDDGTPTALNVDNQSAISVDKGLGLKGNLKHMERRWLQQMVKRKKISLEYIPTSEQPADFLTKALHFPAFNWCSIVVSQVRIAKIGDDNDDVQQ